eukprot:gene11065-18672_t
MPGHTCAAGACRKDAQHKCKCDWPKAWYCSKECQREDWKFHKLDCSSAPAGSVTSAHYLEKAVSDNLFPEHLATLEDYGFERCGLDMDARKNFLGLYIGLMKHLRVRAKTLHSWKIQGKLLANIKAKFETLPEGSRGGYIGWLLENEHVLDPSLPSTPKDGVGFDADAIKLVYKFAGGPDTDTCQEIILEKIKHWSTTKKDCFFMAMHRLGMGSYPGTWDHLWLQFGFCVCRDVREESTLAFVYTDLLRACSFEEFHTAYCSRSLMPLMESKSDGLKRLPTRILEDLKDMLAGSPNAVWSLKQFVVEQAPDRIPPAVMEDYGFSNCKGNDEEVQELRAMYRLYFESPGGEPMKLQEAAVSGQLCECVSSVVDMGKKKKKWMQHLMKNVYPLPSFD